MDVTPEMTPSPVAERGKRGEVDRASGEVRGSGSGAGGGNPGEDYDDDPMAGAGSAPDREKERKPRHPLPESPEARHSEIPESDEREKGLGDEGDELIQPGDMPVDPAGKPYRYDDLGR